MNKISNSTDGKTWCATGSLLPVWRIARVDQPPVALCVKEELSEVEAPAAS